MITPTHRRVFPVHRAKAFLTQCVRDLLPNELKPAAGPVVDLHLDPENFPMPWRIDSERLHQALRDGEPAAKLRRFVTFENTRSIKGICRVMVRTHLNRSGVSYVTRGEIDKTRARRVLGLFAAFDARAFLEWRVLTRRWLDFALREKKQNPGLFDEQDVASLASLARSHPDRLGMRHLKNLAGRAVCETNHDGKARVHNNWAKVVVGIYSGLVYLSTHYHTT